MITRSSSVTMLLVATLVVAGCGSEGEDPREPPNDSGRPQHDGVGDYAQRHFPDRFAGIKATSGDSIVIYRTGPAPEFDQSIRSHIPQVQITFKDAPFSQRRLLELRNRIVADMDYWSSRGIDIKSVGPAVDGTAVIVGVPKEDVEEARRRLPGRYDKEMLVIRRMNVEVTTDDSEPVAPVAPPRPRPTSSDSSSN